MISGHSGSVASPMGNKHASGWPARNTRKRSPCRARSNSCPVFSCKTFDVTSVIPIRDTVLVSPSSPIGRFWTPRPAPPKPDSACPPSEIAGRLRGNRTPAPSIKWKKRTSRSQSAFPVFQVTFILSVANHSVKPSFQGFTKFFQTVRTLAELFVTDPRAKRAIFPPLRSCRAKRAISSHGTLHFFP